jgi:hypothetical protein
MPDPSAPPQPPTLAQTPRKKRSRFWLFAPYVALLVAVLAWSAVWQVEKLRLEQVLTKRVAELQQQGDTVTWSSVKVSGYPFRLHVQLIGPRFEDSAGWGLSAPRLMAQAMAYAPGSWVFVAPDGLILTRPGKGAVVVSGKSLRASVGGLGSDRPRFSFEGVGLSLVPAPGAMPPSFGAMDRLELHLQPGPDDQAALLVRLDNAALRPEVGLAKLASGKPFNLLWDARLTRLSMLRGSNWPGALQTWRNAGGLMTVANAELGLGGLKLKGEGGPLTVDTDGRLSGQLPLKLDAGGKNGLMSALGLLGPVPLNFKDGRASIGPAPVGAALKIG